VVREKLLGGAELAVGSAGLGNKQRRLPPAWSSRGKMTVGKSRGPASLASATGRLLVQKGRGNEALLLVQSDSSGQLTCGDQLERFSVKREHNQHTKYNTDIH
jgi:hypothetical protein